VFHGVGLVYKNKQLVVLYVKERNHSHVNYYAHKSLHCYSHVVWNALMFSYLSVYIFISVC
jgi:hypothetical protein